MDRIETLIFEGFDTVNMCRKYGNVTARNMFINMFDDEDISIMAKYLEEDYDLNTLTDEEYYKPGIVQMFIQERLINQIMEQNTSEETEALYNIFMMF